MAQKQSGRDRKMLHINWNMDKGVELWMRRRKENCRR